MVALLWKAIGACQRFNRDTFAHALKKKKKCGIARHFHEFRMFVYRYRSGPACACGNVRQVRLTLLWLITANQSGKWHWKDKWRRWKTIKGAQANKQAHLSADKPERACMHTQSMSNTTFTHPSCNIVMAHPELTVWSKATPVKIRYEVSSASYRSCTCTGHGTVFPTECATREQPLILNYSESTCT